MWPLVSRLAASLVVAIPALCYSVTASGQAQSFQTADVLGIKLGDTQDKISDALNKINTKVRLTRASVGMSGFMTPLIEFGFAKEVGGSGPDEEVLFIALDYPEQKHVTSLHRLRFFYKEPPQAEALINALQEKYGRASFRDGKTFYWTTTPTNLPSNRAGKFQICQNVYQAADWYAQAKIDTIAPVLLDPSCGIWLIIQLSYADQTGIVSSIDERFTDARAFSASATALISLVRKGAEDAEKRERERRSQVRTPL